MSKKLILLFSVVLLIGLVGSASALDYYWDGGEPANQLWSSPANWDANVPTSADNANIDDHTGGTVLIDSTVTADCFNIRLPSNNSGVTTGTNRLNMTGGSFTAQKAMLMGASNGGQPGEFTMSGGSFTTLTGFQVGVFSPGNLFDMTGGTLSVATFLLGNTATAGGTANLTNVDITATSLQIGNKGSGTVNFNSGTMDAGIVVKIPANVGTGHLQLNGGTITVDNLTMRAVAGGTGTMDVQGAGTMIIEQDILSTVQGYIDSGWLTNAQVNLVGGNTVISEIPEPATIMLLGFGGLAFIRNRNRR